MWCLISYVNMTALRDAQTTGKTLVLGVTERSAFDLVEWKKKISPHQCGRNQPIHWELKWNEKAKAEEIFSFSSWAGMLTFSCLRTSEFLVIRILVLDWIVPLALLVIQLVDSILWGILASTLCEPVSIINLYLLIYMYLLGFVSGES